MPGTSARQEVDENHDRTQLTGRPVRHAMPGLDASSSMAGSAVVLHVHCTGAMV